MTKVDLVILSSDGTVEYAQIDWGGVSAGAASDPITVRIFNSDLVNSATNCRLNAGRADMLITGPTGEDEYAAWENGDELATESWVEARINGDTSWTPIDEFAAYLDLGTILPQGHVLVDLRINIPAGAETFGEAGFNLIARCI